MNRCKAEWSKNWAGSVPDKFVAEKIDEGVIDPGCIPEDRLLQMVEDDRLPESVLEA